MEILEPDAAVATSGPRLRDRGGDSPRLQDRPGTAGAPLGYRAYVDPAHPLLARLFPASSSDREAALDETLAVLSRRVSYRSMLGRKSLDELAALLPGEGAPVAINCINFCCLLVSQLRRAGYRPEQAFVALAGRKGQGEFHAWSLVEGSGGFYWIDPAAPVRCLRSGDDLRRRYRIHALFNDVHVHVLESEKRRMLEAPSGAASGCWTVIFGAVEPSLRALVREVRLRRLLSELLRSGYTRPANDEGEVAKRAVAQGLLNADGDVLTPGPRAVFVPEADVEEARRAADPALDRYVEIAATALDELRRLYEDLAAAREVSWREAAHAVVASMLMDQTVGRRLAASGDGLAAGGPTMLWVFGGRRARHPFGVQSVTDPVAGASLCQLWHAGLRRPDLKLDPRWVGALARSAGPATPRVGRAGELVFAHLGLARGGRRTRLPVFAGEDARRLGAALDEAAARLVRGAVAPALAEILSRPGWRHRAGEAAGRHAAVRLVLEQAGDRMVGSGLLPPFPEAGSDGPDLAGWGRWLWVEPAAAGAR